MLRQSCRLARLAFVAPWVTQEVRVVWPTTSVLGWLNGQPICLLARGGALSLKGFTFVTPLIPEPELVLVKVIRSSLTQV